MNNLRFAKMINILSHWGMRKLEMHELIELEKLTIAEPLPTVSIVAESVVNDLLDAMRCQRKIDAIKAYRTLTYVGLKEAKDAVERYYYPPIVQ